LLKGAPLLVGRCTWCRCLALLAWPFAVGRSWLLFLLLNAALLLLLLLLVCLNHLGNVYMPEAALDGWPADGCYCRRLLRLL
jgi:hypothetical protein